MKRFLLLFSLLFSFSISTCFAQLNDKEKFIEAIYLMDENRFIEARKYLEELHQNDKNNANIKFNLGLAYLKSFDNKDKAKALPFLKDAAEKASSSYTPFSIREKDAPVDAYYYLAIAQHHDYQFIEAKENLVKFRTYINEKHYLWKEVDKRIKMADYAQKAIMNPVEVIMTNLGGDLNGYYPDFSPVVRIDETAIYFTSRRLREDSSNMSFFDPQDGMMYEDLYVSFKDEETQTWGKAQPLNINTTGHEATINLSVDGRTLYIYKDDNGVGGLYESKLLSDSSGYETWSKPKKLGSDINSKAFETHVTITPDGKKLYFISDREGGFGGKDIYVCNLLPTGNWASARNAGPILNTEFDEDGVFMHPDGETMYFSSDGHESMGGYDILYSTLSDSGWSKPTNLGYPINSTDNDVFFVTTPDGKRAYFSSFKEGGYGEKDIYMLQLVDAEETAITLYRGEFTFIDRNVPPEGATVTIINNDTGEPVGYYTPRQRDGQFSAILATNTSYHFIYEADDYETYEEDIYVPGSANYQEIYKEIKLKPVRVGDQGMAVIEPEELTKASVSGALAKDGVALTGIIILLKDEGENLLEQTETDELGEFKFVKLDPSITYFLEIIGEVINPVLGYTIEVKNDKGEVLEFEKVANNTYIFVPSTHPYEYYGISARAISGTIQNGGAPMVGLNVRLEDEQKDMIQSELTDDAGEFQFQKLRLDKKYRIVFDGDFPEDPEIILTNDFGQKLQFKKVDEGIYEYVPMGAPDLGNQMAGIIKTPSGVPISNLNVRLENEQREVLQQEVTDEVGQFNFQSLDLDKSYRIVFEGDVPDESNIVLINEYGRELNFFKTSNDTYEYVPVNKLYTAKIVGSNGPLPDTYVRIENDKRELISRFKTDEIGEFKFKKLDLDKDFWVVFEDEVDESIQFIIETDVQQEITLKRESANEFHYIPPPAMKFKSYTVDVQDEEDYKETYPRPEELANVIAYFQRYFIYNAKDINRNNKDFVSFVNDIAELVKYRGYADIMITSSASKVPTRTWKTNSALTKKRAYDTKALLELVFAEKGITKDQYNFIDINTLVTGPEYKGDYKSNRATYEKYQYVRIFIK